MKRYLLIGGNAVIQAVLKAELQRECTEIAEHHPGLSLAAIEEKALKNCGLVASPYQRESISDRHPNDDWRGKGRRRKRSFKYCV